MRTGLLPTLLLPLLLSCAFPPSSAGPMRPLVVFTFDDGDPSIYSFAFPLMKKTDSTWSATHFLPSSYPGQAEFVTVDQLKEMERGGWETGGHGRTHENLSSVPLDSVEAQVKADFDFLSANGLSHESYAYAFGNYNAQVQAVVSRYFKNIRTSHDFQYLDGVNRRELGGYDVRSEHTADDVIDRVQGARLAGAPIVVLCFHAILPDTASSPFYWCRQSTFTAFLEWLAGEQLQVRSVKQAMRDLGL